MGAEGMAAMTMLTRSLKRRLQRLEDLLPPASEEPNVLVIQFVDSKRQVVGEERITLSAPPRPPKLRRCQRPHSASEIAEAFAGFFPGDRRDTGCGGEQAGAPGVDSYPNARSRPTGSRAPRPTRRALVAGIQTEILVWSPRASLVSVRSRRARGHLVPGELPFRAA
jgi:hypothetical protein